MHLGSRGQTDRDMSFRPRQREKKSEIGQSPPAIVLRARETRPVSKLACRNELDRSSGHIGQRMRPQGIVYFPREAIFRPNVTGAKSTQQFDWFSRTKINSSSAMWRLPV